MNPLSNNGKLIMELPKRVLDDAKGLVNAYLHEGGKLPARIGKGQFFVGEENDQSILAYDAITVSDKEYKIGTLKSK